MTAPGPLAQLPRLSTAPVAHPDAVIRGDHFRITVLTDGLLRLEYSPDGDFEDRASSFAIVRNLPVPEFTVQQTETRLQLTTSRLQLSYDRGPFTASGLEIKVLGGVSNYHSVWRFGEPPPNLGTHRANLGGTLRTLDGIDGAAPLPDGINSFMGFAVLDDSASMLFDGDFVGGRRPGRTDLYFFGYGHDYREALAAFYAVSGPTPLLPRFALGNWWSRYYAYTAEEYSDLLIRFARERLPFTVAVIDMDWHLVDVPAEYGSGWTGYTWNPELFGDPKAFLDWVHEQGYRVTLNIHPADGVRAFEDAYTRTATALGLDPTTRAPIAFDVTSPEFLAAYLEQVHHPLEEQGVDFWWIDWQSGEYSDLPGVDPLWVLNHLHFLDSGRDGRRPLTFSRYAGPGSHRYPVGFSGDSVATWESLDFQPHFTSTAANIGYGWWSHDIGGHLGGRKDDELASRWLQFGCFSPILRLHSTLDEFNSKEPWVFGEVAERIMGEYLRLRHRLIPYLHTMNRRAAVDGQPLVQPVYYDHPKVRAAYEVGNEYLFGTELLVAPVTTPVHRELGLAATPAWLPPGTWVDFFNGTVYAGDRRVTLHRELGELPVLGRAGGIVPLGPDDGSNALDNPARLEVLVFAGAPGAFTLWEEDGAGDGRDASRWAATTYRLDWPDGRFTGSGASGNLGCLPGRRRTDVSFVGFALPDELTVTVAGEEVDVEVVPGRGRFTVRLPELPVDAAFTIRFGMRLAANDVHGALVRLLNAAQIPFATKAAVAAVVRSERGLAAQLADLVALDLDRDLLSALTEMLTADAH